MAYFELVGNNGVLSMCYIYIYLALSLSIGLRASKQQRNMLYRHNMGGHIPLLPIKQQYDRGPSKRGPRPPDPDPYNNE